MLMSQEQKQQSNHSATVRAEEPLDRLGRRLGLLAGRASQRVQGASTALRERAERPERQAQPRTAAEQPRQPATASAEEKGKSATEEAEELVDRMGQRLSLVASLAGWHFL